MDSVNRHISMKMITDTGKVSARPRLLLRPLPLTLRFLAHRLPTRPNSSSSRLSLSTKALSAGVRRFASSR